MKMTKRGVSLLLAALLMLSLAACGGPKGSLKDTLEGTAAQTSDGAAAPGGLSGQTIADTQVVDSETLTVASQQTGVRVDLSSMLFDYEGEEHTLTVAKGGTQTLDDGACRITAYDIGLDGLHELDTFIDIRIPYDPGYCDAGEDPAQCVGAKYYNEATAEWEDVLFDVDAAAHEVVIHTDHLSTYGCFEVRNAGQRLAYISSVNVSAEDISALVDLDESAAAMADYAANGASSEKCYKLGELALTDVFNDVIVASGNRVNDWGNGVGTVLQLSDVFFYTEKYAKANEAFWKQMSYVGIAAGAISLGAEILKPGKSSDDILTIYKDAGLYALGLGADTALGISLVGVSLLDKSIQEFGQAARGYVVERINNIYVYYNDKCSIGSHHARTSKDWRDLVEKYIAEADGDEAAFRALLEADIDAYAREFFNEPESVIYELQSDFAEHFSGGRVGVIKPEEQESIISSYKERMYQRLSGAILKEMQNDYIRRVQSKLQSAMKGVKNELNRRVTVNVREELQPGQDKGKFGLYYCRFSPLTELALRNEGYWTGQLTEKSELSTEQTVIAYILAGMPDKLDLFEKEEDIEKGTVAWSQPFRHTYPVTEIVIKPDLFPTLEEVCGYYENGLITVEDVYIPPELQAAMQAAAESEDGEGCDIDLSQLVGQTRDFPFTITPDGASTAYVVPDNSSAQELLSQVMTYDQNTGILSMPTFTVDDDGAPVNVTFSLNCVYSDEQKSGVVVGGKLLADYLGEYAGLKITIAIAGEKPL